MLNKNKFVNLICALLIGVVIMLVIVSVLVVSGVISLNKMSLTISTKGSQAMYSGIPLTNHNMQVESGVLKDGHKMSYKVRGSQTDVGESENYIDLVITDELDADVTSDYDIEYKLGKLKITPRTILVAYDEESDKYVVAEDFDGLVAGHFISCTEGSVSSFDDKDDEGVSSTAQKYVNVTVYDSYGQDVTQNYNIKAAVGIQLGNDQEDNSDLPLETDDETSAEIELDSDLDLDPELYNVEFYQITADSTGKLYLRSQSYGNYSPGNSEYWKEAVEFDSSLFVTDYQLFGDSGASPYYIPASAIAGNGVSSSNVEIKPLIQGVPYVLPYYPTVYVDNDVVTQTSDVYMSGSIIPNTSYSVQYYGYDDTAVLSDPLISSYEQSYRSFVYENYLYMDLETRRYMQSIIVEQGFDVSDDDIIDKVAKYISSSARYDLNYDTELDQSSNVAIEFLSTYKSGVCKHYATAATLLYRTLGIPARYCVGFVTNTLEDSTVIIKGKNAHAWVEVYIDGFGWVCVEVTDSDSGVVGKGSSDIEEDSSEDITDEIVEETIFESIAENPDPDMLIYDALAYKSVTVYLKEGSFLDYTGTGWTQAPDYDELIRGQYPASMLSSYVLSQSGTFETSVVYLTAANDKYGMPYYIVPDSQYNDFTSQLSDAYYSNGAQNYAVSFYDVGYESFKGLYLPYDLVDYEIGYRDFVHQNYLNVADGELKEYLVGIIESNGLRYKGDIYALIDEVSKYVSSCAVYDLDGAEAIKDSDDIILSFLYQGSGASRHFASTATLLFRLLGVPARYTVGAEAECMEMTNTSVMGDSTHAWVEVYIDGIGWVCVEVTPGKDGPGSNGDPSEDPGENPGENPGGNPGGDPGEDPGVGDFDPTADSSLLGEVDPNLQLYEVLSYNNNYIYLKLKSSWNYIGTEWNSAPTYDALIRGKYPASMLSSFALQNSGASNVNTVDIKALVGLHGMPYYIAPDSAANNISKQYSDTYHINDSNVYTVAHYSAIYSDFKGLSLPDDLVEYELEYRQFVYENYLDVSDGELKDYLTGKIAELSLGADPDADIYSIIETVAGYVRSCAKYDKDFQSYDNSEDIVLDFLKEGSGVCKHFASTATLVFRLLGIPARYTEGAVGDCEAFSSTTIMGDMAHAWVEVYIDGIGWVCVEVTPSSGGFGEGPGHPGEGDGSGEGEGEGEGSGEGSGGGAGAVGGSLSGKNDPKKELYTILSQSNGKVYLKENSLLDYTGNGWTQAPVYSELINGQYPASMLSSFALQYSGGSAVNVSNIKTLCERYGMPYYIIPNAVENDFSDQTSDVYYVNDIAEYMVSHYNAQYTDFKGLSLPSELTEYELEYRQFVYENYLNVSDGELKDYLIGRISEISLGADPDVYAVIDAVASYVRSCAAYDIEYEDRYDNSDDMILDFLKEGSGVCKHFASTATLVFRLLGIPARYTVGAVGNCEAFSSTTIMGDMAHAWVEVYIDGIGWVAVEVTPGGAAESPKEEIIVTISGISFDYKEDENGDPVIHNYPSSDKNKVELSNFKKLEDQGYSWNVIVEDENGNISFSAPGKYNLRIRQVIFILDGVDVTDEVMKEYKVKTDSTATLYVRRPLYVNISGGPFEKYYDGKKYDFSESSLPVVEYGFIYPENEAPGHKIELSGPYCNGTAVTSKKGHQITYKIAGVTDSDNNNFKDEYYIAEYRGTGKVIIEHLGFTVKSQTVMLYTQEEYDAYMEELGGEVFTAHKLEIKYDGTDEWVELIEDSENPGYYFFDESIGLEDHRIKVEFDQSTTDPERGLVITNSISVHVVSLTAQEDVSGNFKPDDEPGKIFISDEF